MSPLLETMAVARTELLRTLRNARVLVLLLLFGTSTALVGLVVGLITRGLDTQDPEAAALMGVNINRQASGTYGSSQKVRNML